MKKIYALLLSTAVATTSVAQSLSAEQFIKLQRKGIKAATRAGSAGTAFPTVDYWVGQGSDSAALVIAWHDGQQADTLVWGYRFNAADNATGAQMLEAIVKADPKLYARASVSQYGLYVEGLGYDRNGDASTSVTSNGITLRTKDGWTLYPSAGFTTNSDATDHFRGGYDAATGKYFAYLVANGGSGLSSSNTGATGRVLTNGAIDVYSYQGWADAFSLSTYTPATKQLTTYDEGVYIVNEDWYGHNSGSINFYNTATDELFHNIHQTPASSTVLGVTTQYGTLHAGRLYLMSKQDKGGSVSEGSRLAIVNASTMQPITTFATLPNGGDGRAFAALTDSLAYVTTSKGLLAFNLQTNSFIGSVTSHTNEMGSILRVGDYALVQDLRNGIHCINFATGEIAQTLTGLNFTRSKDGRVWVLETQQKLQAYDPVTFAKGESIDLPVPVTNAAGAWNAGTLFAGNKANTIYFATATGWNPPTAIYRINLDDATPTATLFADLSQLAPATGKLYGGGIRLRPADDHLFVTTFQTWGMKDYELLQIDNEGQVVRTVAFDKHYWFPALPIFTDSQSPVIAAIADQTIKVGANSSHTLTATDADSYDVATTFTANVAQSNIATANLVGNTLTLTGQSAGTTQITLVADNGGLKSYTSFILTIEDEATAIATASIKGSLNIANGRITATDLAGETLRIYTLDGRQVLNTVVGTAEFTTQLPATRGTYIIKVGAFTLKVQH